jgi:hypothetical protein
VALENLYDNVDIIMSLESIRDNIKTSLKDSLGYYKLMQSERQTEIRATELLETENSFLRLRSLLKSLKGINAKKSSNSSSTDPCRP